MTSWWDWVRELVKQRAEHPASRGPGESRAQAVLESQQEKGRLFSPARQALAAETVISEA